MGASTVSFTTLAIVFDPLPYEKKERIERHVNHMKTYMYDVAEIALYYTKIFFYRVSRWTMSFYIWYGFVIWVPLRIIGAVKYDDDLWYVDRPELVWDTKEEVADVILVIAGIFEFIIFYIVYYFWEIYGHQGRFTVEYTVGKAGEFGWWIFKRFFEKDNEDKEEEQISNIF